MQELLVENSDLRETLQNMQAELVNLLNQQNEGYESNTEVSSFILKMTFIYSLLLGGGLNC